MLNRSYEKVLESYLVARGEEDLMAAYDLGKQFQADGVTPDEVVGVHLTTIERLALDIAEPRRVQEVLASFTLLLEVMISYGLAHAENAERERRTFLQAEQIIQLQELDRMKDNFLGILSHELRTPINAIMGFSSMLVDEVFGPLSPKQIIYVEKILTSSDVMLALVNDLLDMSRVHAGKFTVDIGSLNFADVVREVLANLEGMAAQKQMRFVNQVPGDLPNLLGDRQRVAQILANLISNAIKFTHPGGTITVRARIERQMLLCEVEDTGIGIAKGDLSSIFTSFVQVDMSTTRSTGGTGLGLAICKALVSCHGGALGVRSDLGRGSTFWFTLALAGPPDLT